MDTLWAVTGLVVIVLFLVLQRFKKLFEEKIQEMDQRVGQKFENASNKAIKEGLGLVQDASLKEVSKMIDPIKERLQLYEQRVESHFEVYQEKMDRIMKEDALDRAKLRESFKGVGEKFESVSNKAIKESLGYVQDNSIKEVSKLITPINEKLRAYELKVEAQFQAYQEKMDRLMKEDAVDRAKMRESFTTVTNQVIDLNRGLSEDAKAFTKAMRGDIRALGKFGEDKAELILKASGFNEGHDYFKQKLLTADDGGIKPDFAIRLPGNKVIFIDSKMSLDSFMSYMESESPNEQDSYAKEFLARINDHIKSLCKANYQRCTEFQSMDYVMMFVGSDPAISLALERQPELQREALKKGILLVGPTTLMCSLKSIEFLWREERQVENLKAISEVGGHLYTKMTHFLENLRKANECLDKASESMKKALNHLNRGEKSIIADAKKLNELGGFSTVPLPKIEDEAS